MTKTTTSCQICLEEIKEGTLLYSVSSKLSTFPIKTELTIDENPLACNECKMKIDEEYQTLMQNETFPTNFSSRVSEEKLLKTIKDEFDEVAVKNENTVKEEYVIFNDDIPVCMEKSDVSYYCYQCTYAISDKQQLTNHIFTHQYKCDLCRYTTYDNSSLEEHKEVHLISLSRHNKEEPFKCNFCDYCSSCAGDLKTHMFKHSGEKPFGCDKCEYRCYNKKDLSRHNRIHTREKPFKCDFCDYCSSESGNVKKHMRKHCRKNRAQ